MNEQQLAAMRQALNKAFQLGQRYWSWSDSEYSSHWKKADAAKAEFDKLVEDTIPTTPPAAQPAPVQEPVAWNAGVPPLYPEIKDGETISVEYVEATTPPAQEFVCSAGLCHYKPAIVQRAEEAFESAKQREWQGLTDEERHTLLAAGYHHDTIVVVEKLTKGKNT